MVDLLRVAWRTIGAIVTPVCADLDADTDRLDGLRRIGIDEISYKRGHRYIVVVVDHDTRKLVWAAPGRDKATVAAFFTALGPDRCALITHVSALAKCRRACDDGREILPAGGHLSARWRP